MDDASILSLEEIIEVGLREDLNDIGDVTSLATIPDQVVCIGVLRAKSPGILAGCTAFAAVFRHLDERVQCEWTVKEGDQVAAGAELGRVHGPARSGSKVNRIVRLRVFIVPLLVVLQGERLALNLLQRMSGIATRTRAMVEAIRRSGSSAVLLDTRKTAPGLRALDRAAVVVGGGCNHRRGLFDAVLIKDNHITVAGGITNAVKLVHRYLHAIGRPTMPCVVEARTLDEVGEVLTLIDAGHRITRILLDNMVIVKRNEGDSEDISKSDINTDLLQEAIDRIRSRLPTEASGNITLRNVAHVARTGVDFISCGSLTHSVQAMDLSLKLILEPMQMIQS